MYGHSVNGGPLIKKIPLFLSLSKGNASSLHGDGDCVAGNIFMISF